VPYVGSLQTKLLMEEHYPEVCVVGSTPTVNQNASPTCMVTNLAR
jgi:hypothetical protein